MELGGVESSRVEWSPFELSGVEWMTSCIMVEYDSCVGGVSRVESSCGGVELGRVVMIEYSCVGGVELSRVKWSCVGEVELSGIVIMEWTCLS